MQKSTRQETAFAGKDVEKGIPATLLVGMQVGTATLENSVKSLKKLKIELTYVPAIALLGFYPRDTDIVKIRAISAPMFIATLSMIAQVWKDPRCPLTDDSIKKMWSIYTMKCYSAIGKKMCLYAEKMCL